MNVKEQEPEAALPKRKEKRKESNAKDLNDVRWKKLMKEAMNYLKINDNEEKRNDSQQSHELKTFGKLVESTLAKFTERQLAERKWTMFCL